MEALREIFAAMAGQLETMAKGNAVASKKVSVGNRHMIPLCELSLGFAGAGGGGESVPKPGQVSEAEGKGTGEGMGGAAKATPVALVLVDGDKVSVEVLGY